MSRSEPMQQAIQAQRAGRLEQAESAYRKVLAEQPDHAAAHHNLALLLLHRNQLEAALEHMQTAARLEPESVEILNNLGGLRERSGQLSEAIEAYRQAATIASESPVPHCNLGEALCKAGRMHEGLVALRAAATLDPDLPEAWAALGAALLDGGQPTAAAASLQRAVHLRPEDDRSWCRLGDALQSLSRFEEAAAAYEKAAQGNPRGLDTWYGLGRARMECGRIVQAVEAFQRVLAIDPRYGLALHDLGKSLFELGCLEQALPLLRQAVDAGPAAVRQHALENIAIIVPGSPADDNGSILQSRRTWGAQWPCRPAPPRTRAAGEPLRIGYVSSFFHRPNWMKPVQAVLQHHDRRQFEIHLFCDGPTDSLPAQFRLQAPDRIHGIQRQSNEAAAATITAQQIDILVDLNGYSAPPRMALYPLRPAPVQVGWFNYYATSGLDCFDYLIGDKYVVPAAEEVFFTERILRVPHSYLTFGVDYPVPDVAPPPVLAGNPLTFGSLASQYKLTDAVIEAWSAILSASPTSRLLIRNKRLDRLDHQEFVRGRFAAHGISPDRVLLEGPADHFKFLDTYRRIDVALDPFPYSGGTTTMEALWQGVPVVTFDGDRWAARTSVSLLRSAGLDEFVGRDLQEYVQICIRLANSPDTPERLATLRAGLRDQLRCSPVCDSAGFTRAMEDLYRQISSEWRVGITSV
ncbi:MAG: tetratricopeptide repeat protein [Pirellulaceae bacterium]|nr:tetratricopeptide repeat protein [Pirellulaceae bacterium]